MAGDGGDREGGGGAEELTKDLTDHLGLGFSHESLSIRV